MLNGACRIHHVQCFSPMSVMPETAGNPWSKTVSVLAANYPDSQSGAFREMSVNSEIFFRYL